jgi:cytoskeletal protein CcmA (bactofilin family)
MFFKSNNPGQARSTQAGGARSAIPTLLGSDLRIIGDVNSSGEVQVDGQVEGDIIADCLVVSEAGIVDGAIAANSVRILGVVNGAITAGSVKLGRTARVTGDIIHQTLAVEEGAFVLGHCRRSEPDRPAEAQGEDSSAEDADPAASEAAAGQA